MGDRGGRNRFEVDVGEPVCAPARVPLDQPEVLGADARCDGGRDGFDDVGGLCSRGLVEVADDADARLCGVCVDEEVAEAADAREAWVFEQLVAGQRVVVRVPGDARALRRRAC